MSIDIIAQSMQSDMDMLRAVSNNLANVNTTGYKREIVTQQSYGALGMAFERLMSESSPMITTQTHRQLSQGSLKPSNNEMNVAIEGGGYFVVRGEQGDMLTRQGEFMVDAGGRLALRSGERLQGMAGDVLVAGSGFEISPQGEITQDGGIVDKLQIVQQGENNSAEYIGGGLWRSSADVRPLSQDQYRVRQGYVEASNVQTTAEMLRMIEVVRHFETSSRILQAYDEMVGHSITRLGEFK